MQSLLAVYVWVMWWTWPICQLTLLSVLAGGVQRLQKRLPALVAQQSLLCLGGNSWDALCAEEETFIFISTVYSILVYRA
jgi:hypothetical protein